MKNLKGNPFASITWIRFKGSSTLPRETLSLCPATARPVGSPLRGENAPPWPRCQEAAEAANCYRKRWKNSRIFALHSVFSRRYTLQHCCNIFMRSLIFRFLMVLSLAFSATAAQVNVVPFSSNWRYFLGTNEASFPDTTAWRNLAFNDSSWSSGNAPIGYPSPADRVGFEASIATTIPSSGAGGWLSVYFRKTFQLTNIADLTSLQLNVYVDDGAAAYINGVEVGRINLPAGNLAYNTTAILAEEERV